MLLLYSSGGTSDLALPKWHKKHTLMPYFICIFFLTACKNWHLLLLLQKSHPCLIKILHLINLTRLRSHHWKTQKCFWLTTVGWLIPHVQPSKSSTLPRIYQQFASRVPHLAKDEHPPELASPPVCCELLLYFLWEREKGRTVRGQEFV